mgnify:CR=1 FL=1
MNYQKLTNYLVVVLGLLGFGLLLAILVQGDDTIEMNALQGDFGSVSFIIYLAQLTLAITVLLSLGFSIKNYLVKVTLLYSQMKQKHIIDSMKIIQQG